MASLYLMKRTWRGYAQCRLGYTASLKDRTSHQHADYAWTLMEGTEFQIRVEEQIVSPFFGIPLTLWVVRKKDSDLSQDVIDTMWLRHGNNWNRGKVLLEALNIDEAAPVWQYSKYHRDKEMRMWERWAKRCPSDNCTQAAICQSPRTCKGALPVPEFTLL